MAHSKRSVVTVFSVIYLVTLTVVACYAHYSTQRLSLPLPSALTGLTIILPFLHGIAVDRLTRITRVRSPHPLSLRRSSTTSNSSPRLQQRHLLRHRRRHTTLASLALVLLTITAAALATLGATHVGPPAALTCGLEDAWRRLYRGGSEPELRRIQDAFDCCGLRSVDDMAWPFARRDKDGRPARSTCARTYGRERACLGSWRREERVVGALVVVVCVGVWVWEMLVVYFPSRRPSWLSRVAEVTKPNNTHVNGNGDARRAVGYHDAENGNAGHIDTPIVRVEDADADAEDETGDSPRSRQGSVQRAIEARLGIDGEHDEHHTLVASSPATREENGWERS